MRRLGRSCRAIPGLTFKDVDHVTQWSYCSGGGAGLPIAKPEITAAISERRLQQAAELGVDTLVSACVWSERPLTAAGEQAGIEVCDLIELVAQSAGIDVDCHPLRPNDDDCHYGRSHGACEELEAILGEPEAALTNITSRINRTRVPAPFPVHRWEEHTFLRRWCFLGPASRSRRLSSLPTATAFRSLHARAALGWPTAQCRCEAASLSTSSA